MRIECPDCGELTSASIHRIEGGRVVYFRCAACSSIFSTATEPEGASNKTPPPDAMCCPKCARQVGEGAAACPSCGLGAHHFADFEEGGRETREAESALDTAWDQVVQNWHDESEHAAFVNLAAGSGDYREAARRYREAASSEARNQRAEEMLERIRTMAAAALLSSKPKIEAEQEPFKGVVVLLMILVMLAGAGGIYVMLKGKQSASKAASPTPSVVPSRARPIRPRRKPPGPTAPRPRAPSEAP